MTPTGREAGCVPELAVVVTTVGRPEAFRRLMDSLQSSTARDRVELVLVDQSADQSCHRVLGERTWDFPVVGLTSGPGASVGRNKGLTAVSAPIVAFPDDDAWYPAGTLEEVLHCFATMPALTALCGRQVTQAGEASMLRWKSRRCLVTERNFLRTSIMSTMFFRRSWMSGHGGFDEGMGVGSVGWYGAGEESDLLLRVIEDGRQVPYEPGLRVYQEDPREAVDEAFVRKMLSYGCGQGHLWRKRQLPGHLLAYYCLRKCVAAVIRLVRGQRVLARADLAWLRGSIAGYRNVPPRGLGMQTSQQQ